MNLLGKFFQRNEMYSCPPLEDEFSICHCLLNNRFYPMHNQQFIYQDEITGIVSSDKRSDIFPLFGESESGADEIIETLKRHRTEKVLEFIKR